jgi:large subunit ribosomal protein L24e
LLTPSPTQVRKAQREQAVRAAKETKKSTVKKPAAKETKVKSNMKATKNTQKAAPRVGGKR